MSDKVERRGRKALARPQLVAALLDAAENAVRDGGLRQLSVRDLVREVGCSVGTLYNIFGSLDDLITALNERTLRRLTSKLQIAAREADPKAQMHAIAQAYLAFASEDPRLWRVVFASRHGVAPNDSKEPIRPVDDMRQQGIAVLASLYRHHSDPETTARRKAFLIWTGVHGITVLAINNNLKHVTETPPTQMVTDMVNEILADASEI